MPTTSRGYRYPAPSDAPNGPLQMGWLAQDINDDIAQLDTAATSYTPIFTSAGFNPDLGTGGVRFGRRTNLAGGLIHYRFYIKFGTTGTDPGSGSYRISLPTPAVDGPGGSDGLEAFGVGLIRDTSAGQVRQATYYVNSALPNVAHVYAQDQPVNGIAPWTWGPGDYLSGSITYQGA